MDVSHIIDSVVDTGIKTVVPTVFSHLLNRSDAAKANEYNSPAHLMSLYREAGISPAAAAQALTGSQGITANASSPAQNVGQHSSPLDVYLLKSDLQMRKELNDANVEATRASAAEHRANAERITATNPSTIQQSEYLAKEAVERYNLSKENARQLRLANDRFEALDANAKLQAFYDMIHAYYAARQAKSDSEIARVKAKFAKQYHANPEGSWLQMLIQSVGSGDDRVPKALIQSAKQMLGAAFDELDNSVKEMFDEIFE